MADNWITRFWQELKRRRVVRVAVVYAIVAWVAVEISSVLFPSLLLPDWTARLVVALALVGFPVAIGLAWAFQVTPEGVRKDAGRKISKSTPLETAPQPAGDDRLDSWKRIAKYLNRDVRTLQRWERNEGLPIRRLMHDKQATVYAWKSELDNWREQRGQGAAGPSPARRVKDKPGRNSAWLVVPALLVGLALAWFGFRSQSQPAAVALGEWDWVLITEFENRTGEEVLDDTVEYALRRELANSAFVKVAPPERIGDVLRLMKSPPDTPIDVTTGREISLRDGGIRMLIAGRVIKLGNTYQISTELVNPADGVTLRSFSADATGQDAILPRIRDLAIEVRGALGEGLASIEASREMLAAVTTPSLGALQLYTRAENMMRTPERNQAAALLEEAVRIDPDFASAHLLLSYLYSDRAEADRRDDHMRKAVELAETATEQERLFILATYYDYLEDWEKVIETYQLLIRLYPNHTWASSNLAQMLEERGRFEEALPYKLLAAEAQPNGDYQQREALRFAIIARDPENRDLALERLRAIPDLDPWFTTPIRLVDLHEAWSRGDYAAVASELDKRVDSISPDRLVADSLYFAHIRSLYLALGMVQRFRELSALSPQVGWFEALLDYDSGRPETLDRYLALAGTSPDYWTAALLAFAGQVEAAKAMIGHPQADARVPPPYAIDVWRNMALLQVALAENRYRDAVRHANDSQGMHVFRKDYYLFQMYTLAKAHMGLGQPDQAIAALEFARLQKPITIFEFGATWMWQRNQVLLHRLLLDTGQSTRAAEVAAELRDLLQLADADNPYLVALDQ